MTDRKEPPMSDWNEQANSLFLRVREIVSPLERAAFLDTECGTNTLLREEVESLLESERRMGDFLEVDVLDRLRIPASDQVAPGTEIGPYTIARVIGEGGMGVVYEAHQMSPVQRTVALKTVKPSRSSPASIARFELEYQVLASLVHPNIAQVLDAGTTDDGTPYFVMEKVNGPRITEHCRAKKLDVRQRVHLFLAVLQAIQHAHAKGVIHFDLKPANIIVATFEGIAVPKVIDFGVATSLTSLQRSVAPGDSESHVERLLGTLEYMSPEQTGVGQVMIDTRSDIYSLGIVLYEILATVRPWDLEPSPIERWTETLREFKRGDPMAPSRRLAQVAQRDPSTLDEFAKEVLRRHQLSGELDAIIMKAIAQDPDHRYATVREMSGDLEAYLFGDPVRAMGDGIPYRIKKAVIRHRPYVVSAALLMIAVIVGVWLITRYAIVARRAELLAEKRREEAVTLAHSETQARAEEAKQRQIAEDLVRFLLESQQGPAQDGQSPPTSLSTRDLKSTMLLHLAQAYGSRERYRDMERVCRMCLATPDTGDSHRRRASLHLGTSLLRQKKIEEASQLLRSLFLEKLVRVNQEDTLDLKKAIEDLPSAVQESQVSTGTYDGIPLDGVDDFVVVPNLQFDGHPPWTLEAIVRADALSVGDDRNVLWDSLVSTTDAGGISLEAANGKWSASVYGSHYFSNRWADNYVTALANEPGRLNEWTHVAGVWDGKELTLYINGQLQESKAEIDRCASLSEGPFMIGADPTDYFLDSIAEGHFRGTIRCVRISRAAEYNRSFPSPAQLENSPKTVALFDFTVDQGLYAWDRSGHRHHAVIYRGH